MATDFHNFFAIELTDCLYAYSNNGSEHFWFLDVVLSDFFYAILLQVYFKNTCYFLGIEPMIHLIENERF